MVYGLKVFISVNFPDVSGKTPTSVDNPFHPLMKGSYPKSLGNLCITMSTLNKLPFKITNKSATQQCIFFSVYVFVACHSAPCLRYPTERTLKNILEHFGTPSYCY